MEARQPIGAMRHVFRQELEGNRLAELQVFGSIDFAHAAAPDQANDAIAIGEHRAGNELRAVDRVRRQPPIGRPAGQRPCSRRIDRGAALGAVAARVRDVAPARITAHAIGMILGR
jgi:hypothetical protein